MMEVGSPSLQNARRNEMMLRLEGRSPSVDTPLGVPAGDNQGATMSSQDEAVPMSSFGRVSGIESSTMSRLATTDGTRTTYALPPDNGLFPPILTAANGTAPHNSLFEPSLPNVGSANVFDKGVLKDAGNENIVIPPAATTEGMKVDVDNHPLNMATQPSYLGESQPSQAEFNDIYSRGETQLVHDNQVGLDDTQPLFAGETQPVNCHESFDDMVILQNNTLTSAIPVTNAGQSVSHEPIHSTDDRSLQDSSDAPTFAPRGNVSSNNIPASYYATAEGPNGRMSITDASTVNKRPDVHPAETAGQLGLTEWKEEKDTNTPEPQLGLLNEDVNVKGKAEEGKVFKDGRTEIGVKDDVTGKVVSEQDIQAIKGRKVMKKFGRKNFGGEVVSYDAENQWFKVVYEDGDEEDLELQEVKEILFTSDTPSNASTGKRKRSHREGAVNDDLARKPKGTTQKKGAQKKSQQVKSPSESKTPKKKGAHKNLRQVKSPPESKTKGLTGSAKSKSSLASAHESPVQSQSTSGAKRKRISDVEAMTTSRPESENVGGKVKSGEKKQSGEAKTPRKRSAELGGKAMDSARKKGRQHGSLFKLTIIGSKVQNSFGAAEGDKGGKRQDKRRKIDASKDPDTLVGKAVKKGFGGNLYSGVVAKFDKKTKYYKVKYEDGDQEDLELEELKAVLVQ